MPGAKPANSPASSSQPAAGGVRRQVPGEYVVPGPRGCGQPAGEHQRERDGWPEQESHRYQRHGQAEQAGVGHHVHAIRRVQLRAEERVLAVGEDPGRVNQGPLEEVNVGTTVDQGQRADVTPQPRRHPAGEGEVDRHCRVVCPSMHVRVCGPARRGGPAHRLSRTRRGHSGEPSGYGRISPHCSLWFPGQPITASQWPQRGGLSQHAT